MQSCPLAMLLSVLLCLCGCSFCYVKAFHPPLPMFTASGKSNQLLPREKESAHAVVCRKNPAFHPFLQSIGRRSAATTTTRWMSSSRSDALASHSDDEWHPHDPAWTTPQLLEGIWSQIAQAKDMVRGVSFVSYHIVRQRGACMLI